MRDFRFANLFPYKNLLILISQMPLYIDLYLFQGDQAQLSASELQANDHFLRALTLFVSF